MTTKIQNNLKATVQLRELAEGIIARVNYIQHVISTEEENTNVSDELLNNLLKDIIDTDVLTNVR